jgi:Ca2+:H+ antiporter
MGWLLLFVPSRSPWNSSLEALLLVFNLARHSACYRVDGRAAEQLASHGRRVGGLLNATFGNAAELIIALAALRAGLHDVVKASIVGSIVGNILLVLGAAMLAGGLRRPEQHFNPAGARSQATMLTLAAIALVIPAAFQVAASATAEALGKLSVSISVVLLLVYLLYLAFALVTHAALFAGSHVPEEGKEQASVGRVARAGRGHGGGSWMSGILIEQSGHGAVGLSTSSSASSLWRSWATRPSMQRRSAQH